MNDSIEINVTETENYLALHWRSPYFVNIFVRGRQSEVMKPYTAL